MPHHKVVHRRSMLRVPLFRQRRHAFLNLETIARHVVVVKHLVEQLLLAVVDERIKQVAVADIARGQPVTMSMNVVD